MKLSKVLLWLGIAAAALLLFSFKSAAAETTTAASNSIQPSGSSAVDPISIAGTPTDNTLTRKPKPGYAGPVNGPFYWAGVGQPPDGVYNDPGIPV